MSGRFKQVLEEASKRVDGWPEWKKAEALKLSGQSPETEREETTQEKEQSNQANQTATCE